MHSSKRLDWWVKAWGKPVPTHMKPFNCRKVTLVPAKSLQRVQSLGPEHSKDFFLGLAKQNRPIPWVKNTFCLQRGFRLAKAQTPKSRLEECVDSTAKGPRLPVVASLSGSCGSSTGRGNCWVSLSVRLDMIKWLHKDCKSQGLSTHRRPGDPGERRAVTQKPWVGGFGLFRDFFGIAPFVVTCLWSLIMHMRDVPYCRLWEFRSTCEAEESLLQTPKYPLNFHFFFFVAKESSDIDLFVKQVDLNMLTVRR